MLKHPTKNVAMIKLEHLVGSTEKNHLNLAHNYQASSAFNVRNKHDW